MELLLLPLNCLLWANVMFAYRSATFITISLLTASVTAI